MKKVLLVAILLCSVASIDANTLQKGCKGITKKGTTCKRKAASGSDYCWQHSK